MLDKLGLHSVDFFFKFSDPFWGRQFRALLLSLKHPLWGPSWGFGQRCSEVYFVLNPLFTKTCRMKSIRGLPINYRSLFRPGKTVAGGDVLGWMRRAGTQGKGATVWRGVRRSDFGHYWFFANPGRLRSWHFETTTTSPFFPYDNPNTEYWIALHNG